MGKRQMTMICVYLIPKLYFQREEKNTGPEEILLIDREFLGHRAAETVSIMFHLILCIFPSSI